MSLTETAVRNAKPREKPYKLSDEKGLYVQVNPNGSKLWHLKYRFADRENRLAFGPFPTVTLAMAREQRTEAQRLLRDKVDPGEYKKQAKRAAKVSAANSFEAVARRGQHQLWRGVAAYGYASRRFAHRCGNKNPLRLLRSNELASFHRERDAARHSDRQPVGPMAGPPF